VPVTPQTDRQFPSRGGCSFPVAIQATRIQTS
jgi:hypothetical protein